MCKLYNYLIFKIEIVCVCVCMFASSENGWTKLGTLILWDREEILERLKLREMSWVRVSVRAISVARKLSAIEERRQGQSCLIRRGKYRNKAQIPENPSCFGEYVLYSSETKNNVKTAARPKLFISENRLQENYRGVEYRWRWFL
jgi:hypothetical protein